MSIYWIIFTLPILFGLSPVKVDRQTRNILYFIFGIILAVVIGFRHEIGGDWDRYISIYEFHIDTKLDFSKFKSGDYGYELIVWFSNNYLNGIYSTNFICAILFVSGLMRFCHNMPLPWIALLVSIPFLVIIVSMGYTRQSVAVGFIMWGLVDLMKGRVVHYYIYVIIGALFHKTALIMLPIGFFYRLSLFNFLLFMTIALSLFLYVYGMIEERVESMFYYYITIKYKNSEGAILRVLMSFLSAAIFLFYREKFRENFNDFRLWYIFSIVSILLLPMAFTYSTFVDRVAIFFLPLQMIVLSRLPVLINSTYNRTIFVTGVIGVYALSLFVWLVFGKHSAFWLPYKNILFIS
jgi:hypothetical protein